MRIISGTHKGRRLTAPKNLPVRPTTDFAKEALFNILRTRLYFDEISVLELFAGTGNISFEFASRGVPTITAVDSNYGCIQYINKVSEEFSFPITAIKSEADNYLERVSGKFDIIFADPPYDFDISKFEKIVNLVFEKELLDEEGTLIIEHSKENNLSEMPNFSEARKYGGSVFSFFSLT
ncbi:RsmD family RNA methyltransferase [Aequorivita viscosa]|uniref:16S rRNA (Guanine(966)-N(2))-methyltransferase RsmD n=1 Tax=Aequorivita viscosa TaxID=797419 RepID=A0A1M6F489_9FLAO|nr:RsmD family RNA methyltransferase [Aequorivita viscosa]SDW64797.1 16S rRNA (guanine(966)-N(2))-methyltransferase RsmD [Aequorivita viscosa]SHI92554.1 16S rRNA (guanine(966)-N(2))-methyltransferase RsmD [Aequorivita viscosa]